VRAYLFTHEGEGTDLYRCSTVSDDEIARIEEAREVARVAVRKALFGCGMAWWGAAMVNAHPWLGEDPEIARYLRECCR
jgi:hypothetical protein